MCRFQTMHVFINIQAWKCNNPISTPFNLNTTSLSLRSEDEERPAWTRVTVAAPAQCRRYQRRAQQLTCTLLSGSSGQHSNVGVNLTPMRKLRLGVLVKLLEVTWQFSSLTRIASSSDCTLLPPSGASETGYRTCLRGGHTPGPYTTSCFGSEQVARPRPISKDPSGDRRTMQKDKRASPASPRDTERKKSPPNTNPNLPQLLPHGLVTNSTVGLFLKSLVCHC